MCQEGGGGWAGRGGGCSMKSEQCTLLSSFLLPFIPLCVGSGVCLGRGRREQRLFKVQTIHYIVVLPITKVVCVSGEKGLGRGGL